jgi:uncharacterized protein YbjT (DUF2867 family)
MHHQSGLEHAEIRPANLLGHDDAEPARLGHRIVELMRKAWGVIAFTPVGLRDLGAYARYAVDNGALTLVEFEVHASSSGFAEIFCGNSQTCIF